MAKKTRAQKIIARGEEGTVITATPSMCFIEAYGRQPDHGDKIAAEFYWALFQMPKLAAMGGGRYAILDGGNRIDAVRRVFGEEHGFQAVVHDGLTYEERAIVWTGLNTKPKKPSPAQTFNSAVEGKDTDALAILGICRSLGIRVQGVDVQGHSGPTSKNYCSAIAALYRVHRTGLLQPTMQILHDAWDRIPNAYARNNIQAVGRFLQEKGVDHKRLSKAMAKSTPDLFKRDVRASTTSMSSNQILTGAKVLAEMYNKRLPQEKRIDL